MRYRRKTWYADAERWLGDNREEIEDFFRKLDFAPEYGPFFVQDPDGVEVRFFWNEWEQVKFGQYVVHDDRGFNVLDHHVFWMAFEELESDLDR